MAKRRITDDAGDRLAPGELTQQVLHALRACDGWCTVRDVREILEQDRDIAHTTVLTVLQRLTQQGLLDHRKSGRSGEYRIADQVDPAGARSLVDQALARFGDVAVAQFVERTREDPKLLAELHRLLEQGDG